MLTAIHTMIFAEDAEKARDFLRDVLKFDHVDAGDGWLIFALPPTEMGVHPLEDGAKPHHRLYFMCDDVHRTMEELKRRGVEFTQPMTDEGWGLITAFRIPGAGEMSLYQLRHASPIKSVTPSR